MKIAYNETDRTLEINDGIENYHLVIKFVLTLNVINAILNLSAYIKAGWAVPNLVQGIWMFLGSISLVLLFQFWFRKATTKTIPFDTIAAVYAKSIFGRERYFIQLANGRKRELLDIKSHHDFEALKTKLTNMGVPC